LFWKILACKATAAMAFRTLLAQTGTDSQTIEYVLNSGEEAVGDRYQRGGGNLAKAVAEMCGCTMATGVDIKGFLLWPGPRAGIGRGAHQLRGCFGRSRSSADARSPSWA